MALLLAAGVFLYTHCEVKHYEYDYSNTDDFVHAKDEYSIPQEIRIRPDAYSIERCSLDNAENTYCFQIDIRDPQLSLYKNDLVRHLITDTEVKVEAEDPDVEIADDGIYRCDENGRIYVEVDSPRVAEAEIKITVGGVSRKFTINIGSDE